MPKITLTAEGPFCCYCEAEANGLTAICPKDGQTVPLRLSCGITYLCDRQEPPKVISD